MIVVQFCFQPSSIFITSQYFNCFQELSCLFILLLMSIIHSSYLPETDQNWRFLDWGIPRDKSGAHKLHTEVHTRKNSGKQLGIQIQCLEKFSTLKLFCILPHYNCKPQNILLELCVGPTQSSVYLYNERKRTHGFKKCWEIKMQKMWFTLKFSPLYSDIPYWSSIQPVAFINYPNNQIRQRKNLWEIWCRVIIYM